LSAAVADDLSDRIVVAVLQTISLSSATLSGFPAVSSIFVNRPDAPLPNRSGWPASDSDFSHGGLMPTRSLPDAVPGRSGEGAESVLPHLREQEERRKPLSDQ
jgi:hypothetical protein